jgi:hypothetical protein
MYFLKGHQNMFSAWISDLQNDDMQIEAAPVSNSTPIATNTSGIKDTSGGDTFTSNTSINTIMNMNTDPMSILTILIDASVFVISTILVFNFFHLYLFFGSYIPVGRVALGTDDGLYRLTVLFPATCPLMLTPG